MSLENTAQFLNTARQAHYCVGAFNIVDYLSLEAVIHAAETNQSPVILQTSSGTVRRFGAERLVAMTKTLADHSQVPIGLHLDHGTDLDLIQACIMAGYSSVMIDASRLPFEQNIAETHQVVEMAHRYGVSVEGEIGVLAGAEEEIVIKHDQAIYTTPTEAIEFQERSGVDFLAVAIGTAHGFYKEEPRLDINTLHVIHDHVDFPLVIHGGTGLSMDTLRMLVLAGAAKLNVSTQLKKSYIDALKDYLGAHQDEYNPLKLMQFAHDQVQTCVGTYMHTLGCAGKAQ
jgi:ketose-bisphosphate aldolase